MDFAILSHFPDISAYAAPGSMASCGHRAAIAVQSLPESGCDFAVFMDPISSGEYKRVF
jgi:hypothetical protein